MLTKKSFLHMKMTEHRVEMQQDDVIRLESVFLISSVLGIAGFSSFLPVVVYSKLYRKRSEL